MKTLIAALLLMVAAVAHGDATVKPGGISYVVRRGPAAVSSWTDHALCEAEARRMTPNATAPIRSFQVKSGSGAVLATETSLAACQSVPGARITAEGRTRTTGGTVLSCSASTKYSTAFQPPTCLATFNTIGSFKPGTVVPLPDPVCDPAPGPKDTACPTGAGTFRQVATRGPAPVCEITWAPSVPTDNECQPAPVVGNAILSWQVPMENTDGSVLRDLAGYRVVYGTSPNALSQVVQLNNPAQTRYVISGLSPGTYYFGLKAFTTGGRESGLTDLRAKTIR